MSFSILAFLAAAVQLTTPVPENPAAPNGSHSALTSSLPPLTLLQPGAHELRVISPTVLELTLIGTKRTQNARPAQWDFVGANGRPKLPDPADFEVIAGQATNAVKSVGFKRRVLYAPLRNRDLRIGNYLYLQLHTPLSNGVSVEVRNPNRKHWQTGTRFVATPDPFRLSPAIHVNQSGYLPGQAKIAMVGYYLGNLGELNSPSLEFQIVEADSGREVFRAPLKLRADRGFSFTSYQRVLEADFTAYNEPGEYRVSVAGLGVSFPFHINDGVAGAWARAYALGIYHQRCGGANELPYTRFAHGPCHLARAEIPSMDDRFEAVNYVLEKETEGAKENPKHKAPQLKSVAAGLYPLLNKGAIDVAGGHHDAGDYSKYTANSAAFIHLLMFAVDNFPGVRELDNLGLPESGNGRSDILDEVKWEADFLAKMQDADGGFYFLVYPRDRRYEDNVTPDKGDPQVVFPKNTAVTAAATAALAQCASSPEFKKHFPNEAAAYLEKAKKGWAFLQSAIAKHGKDGAYQKITHYGDLFSHDDELAWAACEMFAATGDPAYQKILAEWFNPADPETRRWSWWRMFDAYGNAIRSYAFAARSGRLKPEQLDPVYLERCEAEIVACGEDQQRWSEDSAYGTSFPSETKATRTAGWYFSGDAAFDLAVACQLDYPSNNDPRPKMREALIANLNYEFGNNPVNVSFVTGTGWKRQREIVHQYAQNDRRILPPTGIPLGNLQGGFGWLEHYGKELGELSFPSDGDPAAPYPIYDRWGDSFNLSTEFVISNQARGLGAAAWVMAGTPLRTQTWKPRTARITPVPGVRHVNDPVQMKVSASGVDLSSARIVWEAGGHEPAFGQTFLYTPKSGRADDWIEAEVELPDGRRVFGVSEPQR